MTTFFHAWRRRQAEQQAVEWAEERDAARRAVEDLPEALRREVRPVMEALIEGPDEEVERALGELERLLAAHPGLHERFFRLRIVDDAVEFLKS